ncbi:DUF222 domain-containing protein [Rothia sp. ARF10]|nr:DUF222 domain-containing protein [Rothia sp. ARF10]
MAALRALEAARVAIAGVRAVLPRLSGHELARAMGLADAVKSQASATQVLVTTEAAHRGEFVSARRGLGSAHEWVREHAPSMRQAGAGQLAAFATEVAHCTPAGAWSAAGPRAGAYADPERAEGVVWARVVTGEIGVPLATAALTEVARLRDRLEPDTVPTVATAILDHGARCGAHDAKSVRSRLLAMYGLPDELDRHQGRLRKAAHLSSPQVHDGDVTGYDLALTPEQSAILEAALGPLSRPQPDPETGVFDPRGAGQRRAEALAEICRRHVATEGDERGPAGASTALHVTMSLDDLRRSLGLTEGARRDGYVASHGRGDAFVPSRGRGDAFGPTEVTAPTPVAVAGVPGCGVVLGSRAAGTLLSAGTVRRLACDADVIPVVLGAQGEVLDVGRAARLFTRAQRRALTHRDGGCTWPGCDAPAAWVRAHHVVHWVDGGRSDIDNAALLCQRHHTHVHDQRLVATVHPPDEDGRSVTWDTSPGSYDLALPQRLAALRRSDERRRSDRRRDAERRRRALDTGGPDPWADAWVFDEDAADEFDRLHHPAA